MNFISGFIFIFLLGNITGLVLWSLQYLDWYVTSNLFKFIVITTGLSILKLLWISSNYMLKYESLLYTTILICWCIQFAWIAGSIFLSIITSECVNILSNYYKYTDTITGNLTCTGEIVTTTFTVLLTFAWIALSFHVSSLPRKRRQQHITMRERPLPPQPQVQMQEVNRPRDTDTDLEMENVPL